jgi:hypothetical protein
MASPPDDDRFYLRVYRSLSEILSFEDSVRRLTEAADPHEVLRIIRSFE